MAELLWIAGNGQGEVTGSGPAGCGSTWDGGVGGGAEWVENQGGGGCFFAAEP